VQASTTCDTTEVDLSDLDLFWNPNFMEQDMLPSTLFDTNFPFIDTPPSVQPPRISSFSRFSSRLLPLEDTEDDAEDGDQAEDITGVNAVPWSVT
jgi:hypothetical protein